MASTAPIMTEDAGATDDVEAANDAGPSQSLILLAKIAHTAGDLSGMLDAQTLTRIGSDALRDYRIDCSARSDWETTVRDALKRAAQEEVELKNPPPYRHSHVDFPILTVAAYQFNARAYPAICKSGDMVRIKVIGSDKGRPQLGEDGQPLVSVNGQQMPMAQAQAMIAQVAQQGAPQTAVQPGMNGAPGIGDNGGPPLEPEPVWQIAPGAKQKRADRVALYLNVYMEYRLKGWEDDTDAMFTQIPIVGCGFRKVWWAGKEQRAAYIPALDLVVPQSAKSLETTPRITEIMRDVYPYQIKERIAAGTYRAITLIPEGEDVEAPRTLLEAHRLIDLDGDGMAEPYVVTIDEKTEEVLRIEANFAEDDVHLSDDQSRVVKIDRRHFYVKYPFLPDPKGGFYDIGFGHLVKQVGDVINVAINQMLDAGHAQIAGGGFIASGVRLQSGNRSETLRWQPGEYKTVDTSAADLRAGIVERTFPNPSPIMMQLLELMLGAARDITSVKDIVTGDAPNTAPVGTTLALIEQGLQVFTAIYKRTYRAIGTELGMIRDNLAEFGGEDAAEDYMAVLDDPEADFAKDFEDSDMDIKPVADPTAVTSAQRIAKAQVLAGMRGQGLNDMEINRRILAAANIEDIEALMPPQNVAPDPMVLAELRVKTSTADLNTARAAAASASATKTGVEVGHKLGESEPGAGVSGGVPSVESGPSDPMGAGGAGGAGGGAAGGMGASGMGPGEF